MVDSASIQVSTTDVHADQLEGDDDLYSCANCGQPIEVGAEMYWSRGTYCCSPKCKKKHDDEDLT